MSQALKKIKVKTTFDRILEYYQNPDENSLSAIENKMLERWETAFSLLRTYKGRSEVVNMLILKFGISKAQAYRDVDNSMNLFGDIRSVRKDGLRNLISEFLFKAIEIAMAKFDLKSMVMAAAQLIKLHRLEIDDEPVGDDLDKIQQHEFYVNLPPQLMPLFSALTKGNVDLTDLRRELKMPEYNSDLIEEAEAAEELR